MLSKAESNATIHLVDCASFHSSLPAPYAVCELLQKAMAARNKELEAMVAEATTKPEPGTSEGLKIIDLRENAVLERTSATGLEVIAE